MSQSCFSLEFFSQNSLWKLSTFRGYKGYLYWCVFGMRRVSFSKIKLVGDLASGLNWVVSSSHELIESLNWTFCPVMLQLAWLFSFSTCFTRVHPLAACKPRDPVASSCFSAHSWTFFHTLSHTTFTWFPPKYRVSKCWITSKLAQNKANKMVD